MHDQLNAQTRQQTVALMGATGLVGRHLLVRLSQTFDQVVAYGRRDPMEAVKGTAELNNVTWVRTDFSDTSALDLSGIDQVFITFGTTKSQAGSVEAFRQIDLEMPLAFAKTAVEAGARRLFLVSAVGADSESWIFYNRIKGELEDALRTLGLETLVVFRPSLLIGEHPGRMMESLGQMMMIPFARFMPATVRPIEADQLAQAIVNSALSAPEGEHWISGKDLWTLVAQPAPRDTDAQ